MADAFLHLHHTGEDVGLWPLVRTRNPGREELEMMPVVAATLADEQYRAVEHEHFVEAKGLRELGAAAHWVLDGLPQEGRDVMLAVVPAAHRFVLLHGFGRSYRRAAARRWGDGAATKVPSLQQAMARRAP